MEKRYTEGSELAAIVAAVEARMAWMLVRLQKLVEIESPSSDKAAVDAAVDVVAVWCDALGGRVKRHRQKEYGDLLEISFGPAAANTAQKPVMLLGHLDTVWALGTLAKMP